MARKGREPYQIVSLIKYLPLLLIKAYLPGGFGFFDLIGFSDVSFTAKNAGYITASAAGGRPTCLLGPSSPFLPSSSSS